MNFFCCALIALAIVQTDLVQVDANPEPIQVQANADANNPLSSLMGAMSGVADQWLNGTAKIFDHGKEMIHHSAQMGKEAAKMGIGMGGAGMKVATSAGAVVPGMITQGMKAGPGMLGGMMPDLGGMMSNFGGRAPQSTHQQTIHHRTQSLPNLPSHGFGNGGHASTGSADNQHFESSKHGHEGGSGHERNYRVGPASLSRRKRGFGGNIETHLGSVGINVDLPNNNRNGRHAELGHQHQHPHLAGLDHQYPDQYGAGLEHQYPDQYGAGLDHQYPDQYGAALGHQNQYDNGVGLGQQYQYNNGAGSVHPYQAENNYKYGSVGSVDSHPSEHYAYPNHGGHGDDKGYYGDEYTHPNNNGGGNKNSRKGKGRGHRSYTQ